MRILILVCILLIELSIIGFLVDAQAEHISSHDEIVLHPLQIYGQECCRHEIHIVNVWIHRESPYIPFESKCAMGYELTEKGTCTLSTLHWWVYPLRLISEMPSQCDDRALGCVLATGIYIINGNQGALPAYGGCSILYHEIKHIEWGWMGNDLAHDRMAEEYPNERCAV